MGVTSPGKTQVRAAGYCFNKKEQNDEHCNQEDYKSSETNYEKSSPEFKSRVILASATVSSDLFLLPICVDDMR